MRLPATLSRWAEILDQLPKETALGLGVMIRRLAQAVGPLKYASISGTDEPDGFSGLTNRGTVEHLLPSEWLLADEISHEFDRRAAMGEQLFFRPHRVEFKEARTSTVLFDAGPSQLGAPRIAHLALLILFERRARDAGAEFFWGVLQEPDKGWMNRVNAQVISGRLLAGRSWRPPNHEMTDAWNKHAEHLGKVEDSWVIGGIDVEKLIPGSATIEIEDELDPHQKTLALFFRKKKGARSARLSLPLPEEPIAAQLLRNPFVEADANYAISNHLFKPDTPLLFSKNALKIAVISQNGEVVAYPIPNTAKEPIGRSRCYTPYGGEVIIGVELLGKRIMTVTADQNDRLKFNCFPELMASGPQSLDISEQPFARPRPDRLCSVCYVSFQEKYRIMVLDADGTLYCTDWPITSERLKKIDHGVTQMADLNNTLVYAAIDTSGKTVRIVSESHGTETLELKDGAGGHVFFGAAGWADQKAPGLFAINTRSTLWLTVLGTVHYMLNPVGAEVVGVVAIPNTMFDKSSQSKQAGRAQRRPCLVTICEDKKTVSIFNKDRHMVLITSAAPIVQIRVDPLRGSIGYTTTSGDLVVYSLKRKAEVMRVAAGSKQ